MSKTISTIAILATCFSFTVQAAESLPAVSAKQILKTTETWHGAPVVLPGGKSEVTALAIEIQPGAETGWHKHPVPSFAFVVQGSLQVTLRDGRTRRFEAGEAFAEVVDTAHNGRNVGTEPTKLLVLYTASQGSVLTTKD